MAKEKELKDLFLDTLLLRGKEDPVGIAEDGQGGAVPEIEGRLREALGRD
jgi:hypothetical protein